MWESGEGGQFWVKFAWRIYECPHSGKHNLFSVSDIGYGNYVLTAPVERSKRTTAKNENSNKKSKSVEQFDVPELLSPSNTLTNPNAKKQKIEL